MNPDQAPSRLQHFPIAFFAMIMGLAGLTIGWEKAHHLYALELPIHYRLFALTAVVFLLLAAPYGARLIRYRDGDQAPGDLHRGGVR